MRTWGWVVLALGVALAAGWIVFDVHGRADVARQEQVALARAATQAQQLSVLVIAAETDPASVPGALADISESGQQLTQELDRLGTRHQEIGTKVLLSRAALDRYQATTTDAIKAVTAGASEIGTRELLRRVSAERTAFMDSLTPLDAHLAREAQDENRLAGLVSIAAMAAAVGTVAGLSRRAHRARVARATWEASHRAVAASEARFRSLIEHAADLVLVIDDAGIVQDAGGSIERILGRSPDDTLGAPLARLVHDDDLPRVTRCLADAAQASKPCVVEVRLCHGDGSWHWVELAATDRLTDPLVAGVVLNGREVTERRQAEAAVREREAELNAIFDAATAGITMMDRDGVVQRTNLAAERIFGLSNGELVGLATSDPRWNMIREDGTPLFFGEAPGQDAMQTGEAISEVIVGVHRSDGTLVWVAANARPLRDPADDTVTGAVVSVVYITARKLLEDRLRHEALHDPLTGLANRVLFLEQLERAMAQADRQGTSVATMFIDLDGFKEINDRLGHEAGDRALIEVATRLRQSVRTGDTIARFGGDEFALLFEGVGIPDEVVSAAERILASLMTPYIVDGEEVRLNASVGIAVAGDSGTGPTRLLRNADVALYRAKSSGKGRYVLLDRSTSEAPVLETAPLSSNRSTSDEPPTPPVKQVR